MNKKVLVIAAHPDDEILGCGGTMAKHVKEKDKVHTLILGEGETSRSSKRNLVHSKSKLNSLQKQMLLANNALGVHNTKILKLPDNRFDSLVLLDIVKKIEKVIFNYKPDIIYTHSSKDLNQDHKITNQAVLIACRPQGKFKVKKILFFEILSSTEWQNSESNMFKPNYYINISKFIDQKLEALSFYKTEIREWPHPRSMEGVMTLSKYRGSQVGFLNAESFYLAREIKN